MTLANCVQCGKLYAKTIRDICPACVKVLEKEYEVVSMYLRRNRGATLSQCSEATGVSEKQIIRFIREGRISTVDLREVQYPCEACGAEIQEGKLCDDCRRRFTKDLTNAEADRVRNEQLEKEKKRYSYNIHDRLEQRKQ